MARFSTMASITKSHSRKSSKALARNRRFSYAFNSSLLMRFFSSIFFHCSDRLVLALCKASGLVS